jgi:hypothetical protein
MGSSCAFMILTLGYQKGEKGGETVARFIGDGK